MKKLFATSILSIVLTSCASDPCQLNEHKNGGLALPFGTKSGQSVEVASTLVFGETTQRKSCAAEPVVEIMKPIKREEFSGQVRIMFFGNHGLTGIFFWPTDQKANPNKLFNLPTEIKMGERKEIDGYEIHWGGDGGLDGKSTVFSITDKKLDDKMTNWISLTH